MNTFDVLQRECNIHRSYFLEASAGTGKTFSIVHIVVRSLLEQNHDSPPLHLEKILVVTFTRAATQELQMRLRQVLEQTQQTLRAALHAEYEEEKDLSIDYLAAIIEKGHDAVRSALRQIEHALIAYEQMQIFTIHGFCHRMLREYAFEANIGLPMQAQKTKENIPFDQLTQSIKDFFRTELQPNRYCSAQLNTLLRYCQYDFENLLQKILHLILHRGPYAIYPSFEEVYATFCSTMSHISQQWNMEIEKCKADFALVATNYKKTCDRQGRVLQTLDKEMHLLGRLLMQKSWSWHDLELLLSEDFSGDCLRLLSEDNRKAKSKAIGVQQLHYPTLLEQLQTKILPLLLQANDPDCLLLRMAQEAQKHIQKVFSLEDLATPDDLLDTMLDAIENNAHFVSSVQSRYQRAVIDEFQDTDAIQWKIFQKLFVSAQHNHYLYLVGDPKQSIYAFRKADIYTYLAALRTIGEESHATLRINYRSQPGLIAALNTCFMQEHVPGLFSLPKDASAVPYRPVMPPSTKEATHTLDDGKGDIHWMLTTVSASRSKSWPPTEVEEEKLIPAIAHEISALHRMHNIELKQCAVLVRDRWQALRVQQILKNRGIPSVVQRSKSLLELAMYTEIKQLLQAFLHPYDGSFVHSFLLSRLIGYQHEQIASLPTQTVLWEKVWKTLHSLRSLLMQQNIVVFAHHFLYSSWHQDQSNVMQRLLMQEEGLEQYMHFLQWIDLLSSQQTQKQLTPSQLLRWMQTIQQQSNNLEELKLQQSNAQDAVQILTLHMSKGLEFDVVFALGLCNRTQHNEPLIPMLSFKEATIHARTWLCQSNIMQYHQEIDAEKMRQLYVAMTRAKKRLYMHFVVPQETPLDRPAYGSASPLEIFFACLFEGNNIDYALQYEKLMQLNVDSIESKLQQLAKHAFISWQWIEDITDDILLTPKEEIHLPLCMTEPNLSFSFSYMQSYSSMLSSHTLAPFQLSPASAHGTSTIGHLPPGKQTGIILHKLLQYCPFDLINTSANIEHEITSYVERFVKNSILSNYSGAIANMIMHVLHTPLSMQDEKFYLADIDFQKTYCEMEFLFPWQQDRKIAEITIHSGFITGFIDFVFFHRDKYYFIDWKSNWLGAQAEDYHAENMQKAMVQQRYELQASVYAAALKKYLHLIDPHPFSEIFGGCFYFFLRGVDKTKPSQGVYFLYPQPIDVHEEIFV